MANNVVMERFILGREILLGCPLFALFIEPVPLKSFSTLTEVRMPCDYIGQTLHVALSLTAELRMWVLQ